MEQEGSIGTCNQRDVMYSEAYNFPIVENLSEDDSGCGSLKPDKKTLHHRIRNNCLRLIALNRVNCLMFLACNKGSYIYSWPVLDSSKFLMLNSQYGVVRLFISCVDDQICSYRRINFC